MSSGLYSGVSGLALGSGLYRNVSGLWGGASGLAAGFGGGSPYGGASLYLDFLSMTAPTFDNRITFTRGSNATLTDSTGKLTYAPANLVTYSQEFDNAAWTKSGAGVASAPTVTANAGVAPDGTTTADRLQFSLNGGTAAGDIAQIIQSPTYTVANYIFSVWLKSNTGGNQDILLVSANAQGSVETVTPTWQRFTRFVASAVAGASVAGIRSRGGFTSNTSDILAWGAQLEPVTYQTTPGTYNATTSTAYYGPRFDYDPVTLAAKGLLIEEARTNLLTYSEQFDNAAWTKSSASVTPNATVSPDGTTTADKLIPAAASIDGRAIQSFTGSIGATYTLSIYAKQAEFTNCRLYADDGATNTASVAYNLATGVVSTAAAIAGGNWTSVSSTATSVGNGWWRLTLTWTSTAVAPTRVAFWCRDTGTGTSGVYLFGAQLEAGVFATSYIPTVASTATRSADVATMTGTNFSGWYNQSEGTFVVGATYLNALSTAWVLAAHSGTAGSTNDYTALVKNSGANNRQTIVAAGVSQGNLDFAGAVAGTVYRLGGAYAVNNAAFTVNGATPLADATVTLPTPNALTIGNLFSQYLNGHIREIAYFNTRLPDAQLQSITT